MNKKEIKKESKKSLPLVIAVTLFAFFVSLAIYHMPKEPPKLNTDFNKIYHYKQGARDFANYLNIEDEKLNKFYEKVDELMIKYNSKR